MSGGASVPILMYHVINPPPPGAKFPGLYVPREEFSEQVQALAKAGYRAVTMDAMLANWTHGTPLAPGKPIVLSFDNGYQSQLTKRRAGAARTGMGGRGEHPAHRPPALPGGPQPRAGRPNWWQTAGSSTRRGSATPT